MTVTILDCNDREITVGKLAIYGSPPLGETDEYMVEVISISDPDGDYDDELGRGVEITPRVKVCFNDGTEEDIRTYNGTPISWVCYPNGPDEFINPADALEVIT